MKWPEDLVVRSTGIRGEERISYRENETRMLSLREGLAGESSFVFRNKISFVAEILDGKWKMISVEFWQFVKTRNRKVVSRVTKENSRILKVI